MTYRELIKELQRLAEEHGDHILDFVVRDEFTTFDLPTYQPAMPATEEFDAEKESLRMSPYN